MGTESREFQANFHIFFISFPEQPRIKLDEFSCLSLNTIKDSFTRPPTNLTNITKACLFKYNERILPPKNKKNPIKLLIYLFFHLFIYLFIYLSLIRIFAARMSLLFKEKQARTLAILASFVFIQTKSRILICSYHVETLTA